jgi:hypothetical protein
MTMPLIRRFVLRGLTPFTPSLSTPDIDKSKPETFNCQVCEEFGVAVRPYRKITSLYATSHSVHSEGLEPTLLSEPEPKSGAAANYATNA